MANNPNHMDNLKNFQPGFDERRNMKGRPKRLLNQLKEQGYGYAQQDLSDAIAVAIDLPVSKLVEIETDKTDTYTALEKIAAKTVFEAVRTGKLHHLEILFGRSYGKPKESSDVNVTGIEQGSTTIVQVIHTGVPLATSEQEAAELYK